MNLLNIFKNFAKDESGAVTVDWVVLTGAVVGLGLLVSGPIGGAITGKASSISSAIGGTSSTTTTTTN